jgi:hypothetical protein
MTRLPGSLVALGLALLLGTGCGAIEYSVYILQAHEAVAEAQVSGAGPSPDVLDAEGAGTASSGAAYEILLSCATDDEEACPREQRGVSCCLAPYEYTYAMEHLRKAREEVGQADYQAAVDMARLARDYARKARDMAAELRREAGR